MLEIRETEDALQDVADIWYFIGVENSVSADPVAADRVALKIRKTFGLLAQFPDRSNIPQTTLYKATVKGFPQYLIIYEFDNTVLTILRVIHVSQDWQRVIAGI